MSSIDTIKMGLMNLWRRKLRTFLTVLGVLIGCTSIVVMLSLGLGMSKAQEDLFASFGDLTEIQVYKSWGEGPGSKPKELDDKAIQEIKNIDHVIGVLPDVSFFAQIKHRNMTNFITVKGVTPSELEAFGFNVVEGRSLHEGDRMVALVGSEVGNQFFNPHGGHGPMVSDYVNLLEERAKFYIPDIDPDKSVRIEFVGLLESKDWDTNSSIILPLDQVEKIKKEIDKKQSDNENSYGPRGQGQKKSSKPTYNELKVRVDNKDFVTQVEEKIKDMGFESYSSTKQLEEAGKSTKIIQAILGGIGGVSLLVAAIGITNTMIMSIYERTKEIGVMKVIGASIKDIKRLFLFEAAIIGLIGGILGVATSYLGSFYINKYTAGFIDQGLGLGPSKISIIPPILALSGMVFSSLVGLLAGYFPARRAMNLSALEAIKTE